MREDGVTPGNRRSWACLAPAGKDRRRVTFAKEILMSRNAVISLQGSFHHAMGLLEQFIDVCPDAIWSGKFGGWPVWQQIYHGVVATEFFALREGDAPTPAMYPQEVTLLSGASDKVPSKADMKQLLRTMKTVGDRYINDLTDADLGGKNEGLSVRMQRDTTHAATLALLSGHILYHLGSGDAALREAGLKGVF